MRIIHKTIRILFFLGLIMMPLLLSTVVEAAPAVIQTTGNESNASPGSSCLNVSCSALISILVTNGIDGTPVTNLGFNVGNGNSAISLPSGWVFREGFNGPPGGFLMTITQFSNNGNGIYSIRVVPTVINESSRWFQGEYHYAIEINTENVQGSGLGILIIEGQVSGGEQQVFGVF